MFCFSVILDDELDFIIENDNFLKKTAPDTQVDFWYGQFSQPKKVKKSIRGPFANSPGVFCFSLLLGIST